MVRACLNAGLHLSTGKSGRLRLHEAGHKHKSSAFHPIATVEQVADVAYAPLSVRNS